MDLTGLKFKTFDPLVAPGNVAIYDGDVNLSAAVWRDNAAANQITFFNAPTYNAAGLNGHGTILFNGTTQYGNSTTPNLNQPYTLYMVLNQVTWNSGEFIFDDGNTASLFEFIQSFGSPNLFLNVPPNGFLTNELTLNTWKILTIIVNGINSSLRVNNNPEQTGDLGSTNISGITLASKIGGSLFSNCAFAYIIMRNVADPIWLQNNFINWLKNRFAI